MISVNSPGTGAASKWVRRAAAGPRRISLNCLVISQAITISRSPNTWAVASSVARMEDRWDEAADPPLDVVA
jgi:hypothetical protein